MFLTIIDFFQIRDNRFKNETNKTKNLLNMEQCHCPLSFKIACLIFSFKLLMLFPIWFKHSVWYYIFVSFYFSFASITFFTSENLAILVTCYLWSPSGSLQVGQLNVCSPLDLSVDRSVDRLTVSMSSWLWWRRATPRRLQLRPSPALTPFSWSRWSV